MTRTASLSWWLWAGLCRCSGIYSYNGIWILSNAGKMLLCRHPCTWKSDFSN